jgi:hypothetical protein
MTQKCTPPAVRASISSWLKEVNMDGSILDRSGFKALEDLWAKAQETVQLQHQVDHLRVLDLEMAERTQAECNGQADSLVCADDVAMHCNKTTNHLARKLHLLYLTCC